MAALRQAGTPDEQAVDAQLTRALLGQVCLASGDRQRAAGHAERIAKLHQRHPEAVFCSADLGFLLSDLAMSGVVDVDRVPVTGWAAGLRALLDGDHRQAAVVYQTIGALPETSLGRLRASHTLAAGHVAAARAERSLATNFWGQPEVGAAALLRQAAAS